MKLSRFILSLLLFISFNMRADLTSDTEVLVKKDPTKVCLNDVLNMVKLQPDLGEHGPIAQELFKEICLQIDPKTGIKALENGVELTGKAQAEGQQVDAKIIVINKDGKPAYGVALQLPKFLIGGALTKLGLKDGKKVDSFIGFSNVTVAFTDNTLSVPIFDIKDAKKGTTVKGFLAPPTGSFFEKMIKDMGLSKAGAQIYIPTTVKSYKDVQIKLDLQEDPEKGFCPLKAGLTIAKELGQEDIAKQASGILDLVCLFTNAGIAFDEDFNMLFFVDGVPKKEGAPLGKRGMLKVWQADGNKEFSFGFQLSDGFKVSDVISGLNLDLIQLKNPILAYTNADKSSLFDIDPEFSMVDPTLPDAISIEKGINLITDIDTNGPLGKLLQTLQFQKSRFVINIPIKKGLTRKDITMRLVQTDKKPVTKKVKELVPGLDFGALDSVPLIGDILNSEITIKNVTIEPVAGSLTLGFIGTVTLPHFSSLGKLDVEISSVKTKTGTEYVVGLKLPIFKLGTLLPNFKNIKQIDTLIGFKDVMLVLANNDATEPVFGVPNIKKGITVKGFLAPPSGSFLAKALSDMGLKDAGAQVYIPPTAKTYKDVQIKLDLQEDPEKGFCPFMAIKTFLNELKKEALAKQSAEICSLVCLFTNAGVAFDEDFNMLFFVEGVPKKEGAPLGKKGMLKAWQADGNKFAFGFRLGDGFKMSDVVSDIDLDQIKLINPTLTFTNADKASLFDIDPEFSMVDSTLPDAISFDKGLNLITDIDINGPLGKLLQPLQLQKSRLVINIPLKKGITKDDITYHLLSREKKETTICIKDLPGFADLPSGPVLSDIKGACIKVKDVDISRSKDGNFAIKFKGQALINGSVIKNKTADITIMLEEALQQPKIIVGVQPEGTISLKEINPALAPVDQFGSFSNITYVFSNTDYEGSIQAKPVFGVKKIEKGTNIVGAFVPIKDSFMARFTNAINLKTIQAVISLQKDEKGKTRPKILLYPQAKSDKGICLLGALQTAVEGMQIEVAEPLQALVEAICFESLVMGILINEDEPLYFMDGDLVKNTGHAQIKIGNFGKKARSQLSKHKSDIAELAEVMQAESSYKIVLALTTKGDFSFNKISKDLGFLDRQITLKDVTITFANTDDATIFDINIDKAKVETYPDKTIANLPMGLSVVGRMRFPSGSVLGKVFGLIGISGARLRVEVPVLSKTYKDIEIKVETESTGESKPLCLNDISGLPVSFAAGIPLLSKALGVPHICIQKTGMSLIPIEDGLDFRYDGILSVGKKKLDATLVVNLNPKKEEGESKGLQFIFATKSSDAISLSDFGLSSLNFITLNQPQFVLSNQESEKDILGIGEIKSGFSIHSTTHFGSEPGKVLDIINLNDLLTVATIPANPLDVDGYLIEASKNFSTAKKPFAKAPVKFTGFDLLWQGGIPPTFGLMLSTIFNFNKNQLSASMGVSLTGAELNLTGIFKCLKGKCPSINFSSIYPLEVYATKKIPLSLTLHILAPILTGIGGSGTTKLLEQEIQVAFDIDPIYPKKSALQGKFDKLCIADTIRLCGALVGNVGIPKLTIPEIFCVKNAKFSAAKNRVVVASLTIPPGLVVSGDFSSEALPTTGKVKLSVIPPDLINLMTRGTQIGLQAKAFLEPIKYGSVMTITAPKGKSGPEMDVVITSKEQFIKMRGMVNILRVMKEVVDINFTTDGFGFKTDATVAGIEATRTVKIPFKDIKSGMVSYEIKQGIVKAVTAELKSITASTKKTINKVFGGGQSVALKGCDEVLALLKPILNVSCSDCAGGLGGAGIAKELTTAIDTYINKILNQFNIESAAFTISLGDLISGKLPSLIVKYTFLGTERTMTIGKFDATKPQTIVAQIAKELWKNVAPSNFVNLLGADANILKDMAQGVLTSQSIDCKVSTTLGGAKASAEVKFELSKPGTLFAKATAPSLCLNNLCTLANQMHAGVPVITLPQIGCLANIVAIVDIDASKKQTVSVSGSLNAFAAKGKVSGTVSGSGIMLKGTLPKVSIGNIITMDSPAVVIEVDKKKQQFQLTGKINLVGIIQDVGTVTITPSTLTVDIAGMLLGLSLDIVGNVSAKSLTKLSIKATVKTNMTSIIKNKVQQGVDSLTNGASSTLKKITSKMHSINSKVSSVPGGSVLVGGFVSAAEALVKKAKSEFGSLSSLLTKLVGSFSIDSIVLSGTSASFAQFVKGQAGSISVTAEYTLAGSKNKTTFSVKSAKNLTEEITTGIANGVVSVIKKKVQNPLNALNSFKAKIKNIWKEILKKLTNLPLQLFKNLAKNLQELGLDAFKMMGDITNIGALTGDIGDSVTDAVNAAKNASATASKAAEAASKAAKNAALAASKAAEQAAKAASKAASEAVHAAESAVSGAMSSVSSIGSSFGL